MLPTYKRPKRLENFVRSMVRRANNPESLVLVLCLHEGDTASIGIVKRFMRTDPRNFVVVYEKEKRPHLAKFFNMMYEEVCKRFDESVCVSMFGDDMRFISNGWDTEFLCAINEKGGMALVFGDDCYKQHSRLCVHFVTTQQATEATGHPFMATCFRADFIDRIWHNVAKAAGWLVYLPSVKIRHEHNTRKKKDNWDWAYRRLRVEQGKNRRKNNLLARKEAGKRIAYIKNEGRSE
jgi:hypothetical protein